jgi:hypothetical protein
MIDSSCHCGCEVGRIELYIVPMTIISSRLELSEDDTDK